MQNKFIIRIIFTGLIAFGFIGCMHASSGVISMDKGTYYISQNDSRLGMGPPGAETISAVYKEANMFCAKEGREAKKINNIYTDSGLAKVANFSLEFNCVEK